jgi:hypothetical protein
VFEVVVASLFRVESALVMTRSALEM